MFSGGGPFQHALKARVNAELTPDRLRAGRIRVIAKSTFIMLWAFSSYFALILWADTPLTVIPLAISLAFAMGGIGFAIGHDANHGAFVGGKRTNRIVGLTFDLIGASSYVWRTKHNTAHHSFTNVVGADSDIDQMPFARFAPDQPRRAFHRWQHIYVWFLYGGFTLKYHFMGDILQILGGRIDGMTKLPKPSRGELAIFIVGKVFFWTWAIIIPLILHPFWAVLGVFLLCSFIMGITIATVFQLAHCVDEAEFTSVEKLRAEETTKNWAVHQVETTVDFATGNKFLAWYLGGLNFQIEHHLFPKVCHVHYPRLIKVIRETCEEHGVTHVDQPTLRSALLSHARWLREMGRADEQVPVVSAQLTA